MKFKVGEWVRTYDNVVYTITKIYCEDEECELDGVCIELLSNIELWQPKEGEWVVSPIGTDNFQCFKWFNGCKDKMVEPFIGELPSWIKDKE